MTAPSVVFVFSGMLIMAYLVVSLFFMRFWRDTRDRLFVLFSLAFLLLAVQRAALALTATDSESTPWLYLIRLFAFGMILAAILDKNRR